MRNRKLPPLDMHAHIDPTLSRLQLEQLGAVVFAVTRTPAEFEAVRSRNDLVTVWGLGCHPGLAVAFDQFARANFWELMQQTAFIGEVGLDGRSPVHMDRQSVAFRRILGMLRVSPRLVSIHSARATGHVIDCLEQTPVQGAILHWWLGTPDETKRAVDAGCFFSVNMAMVPGKLEYMPLDRLLTETDHPFGDRSSTGLRQPGTVEDVEARLAANYGVSADVIRSTVWGNLGRLISQTGVGQMLSAPVRKMLAAAQRDVQ